MLVVGSGICFDTLWRTIPFSHTDLWVPNTFTPDAESNNRFSVVINGGIVEELSIFNRNGLLVSRLEGSSPEWDGNHNGVACPQGAYVWMLLYHYSDQPDSHLRLIGTVTLLR